MVRRCSDQLAKLLLVVFNGIFLACGIAIFVVGLRSIREISSVQTILDGLTHANIAFLVVGGVIIVISFFGCCGALREHSCMITTFMFLLLVLLISEIVIGYLAFTNRDKVDQLVKDGAMNSLKNNSTLIRNAWDDIEISFKCCGVEGYRDYENINRPIPGSCCSLKPDEKCGVSTPNFHGDGCVVHIKDIIRSHYLEVGITALVIAFVEIVGIIFACCLRGAINERYETV